MSEVRIGITAIYYEMLEVFLANADKLKEEITISGICFQDNSKQTQFHKRNPKSAYAVFDSFESMANNSDEIWIFTYKNKETVLEKDYIQSVIAICNDKLLKYKYVDLPSTEENIDYSGKVTLLVYSDILNYDFIGIELYYREMLHENGLRAQIVNMPSAINECYNILDYPIDIESTIVSDNDLRKLLSDTSYDVVILHIPYDVSNELDAKRYYNLYSALSRCVTVDYSAMVLNADRYSDKQLNMLECMSKTFFSPIDDYFISEYGRKELKSKKGEKERLMRFNINDVKSSADYLTQYLKNISLMNYNNFSLSFNNFRNKIDTSVRPYSVVI